jgi:hypothetical protein
MIYTIESDVPLKETKGRPPSVERQIMKALNVGQSFLIEDAARAMHARWTAPKLTPAKYSIRKVVGQGWRVWRVA